MKTLVVGDLHLKQQFVLPRIDGMLAGDAEIGRVVFLGDACDDWGANEADELNAMEFYAKWVREHRGRGMRIDVLLGNHDFCYVRGKRAVAAFKCLLDHGGLLFRRGMRFGRAAVRASCPLHGKVRMLFLENAKGLVGVALEV